MKKGISLHSGRKMTPAAFTLIELLVVIGIVAILAAIALPVLGRVTTQGHITVTTGNIRQMGISFVSYAQDNNYQLPGRVADQSANGAEVKRWNVLLQPYYQDTRILVSPIDPVGGVSYRVDDPRLLLVSSPNYTSYIANGYNDLGAHDDASIQPRLNNLAEPVNTILLGIPYPRKGNFYMDSADNDQNEILNRTAFGDASPYVFADGSVRMLKYAAKIGGATVSMSERPPNSGVYTDWLWLMDKSLATH